MITKEYRLTGLSKPRSATLQNLHDDIDMYWAVLDMAEDRIQALWNYCKRNWDEKKIAVVECDEVIDGAPINGRVVEIKLA